MTAINSTGATLEKTKKKKCAHLVKLFFVEVDARPHRGGDELKSFESGRGGGEG